MVAEKRLHRCEWPAGAARKKALNDFGTGEWNAPACSGTCQALARVAVPQVPERVDSTIATLGAPSAKKVQSRTNQGFPAGADNSPQRGFLPSLRHLNLLIL
ncbi:hypothetical protein [Pandoraea sp.]|uniref:hypothetical protein n=1 Tax=Pandoraea sp. TaxID=1883445 RepID=UPI0035B210D5